MGYVRSCFRNACYGCEYITLFLEDQNKLLRKSKHNKKNKVKKEEKINYGFSYLSFLSFARRLGLAFSLPIPFLVKPRDFRPAEVKPLKVRLVCCGSEIHPKCLSVLTAG
jgi:hypothetical protein